VPFKIGGDVVGITVVGVNSVVGKLNALTKVIGSVLQSSLNDVGEDLMGKSQALCPVLEGDLRGSANVKVGRSGTKPFVEVGYNMVYARYQHEGTWFNHPQGGQAKYLEQPFKDNVDRYIKAIESDINKSLG
jgi:hypothetical protein